jgi:hypothetical protein
MKNTRQAARTVSLLFALELLDECVRASAIKDGYLGSATEQTVSAAMRQAKKEGFETEGCRVVA